MRKIASCLLITGLALVGLAPFPTKAPAQQTGATEVICNKQFIVSAGATSMTVGVAGISGQPISVCGYVFNAGAAPATIQIVIGTGANCNTGQVPVTPVFELAIDGSLVFSPGRAFFSAPNNIPPAAPYAMCYVITGTGPMHAAVQYFQ